MLPFVTGADPDVTVAVKVTFCPNIDGIV